MKRKGGFTLIELLVAMIILAIVALIHNLADSPRQTHLWRCGVL
ncbi:MAG: type II secretion system protein [Desulfobacteraceae bacterium]|nr:type II secretion system protein [Desulfobacteraceae bacterium]